jgi:hypothetical protein
MAHNPHLYDDWAEWQAMIHITFDWSWLGQPVTWGGLLYVYLIIVVINFVIGFIKAAVRDLK